MLTNLLSDNFRATVQAKEGMHMRVLLLVAMICATFGDMSQLVFMICGAGCFFLVQRAHLPVKKKALKDKASAPRRQGTTPSVTRTRTNHSNAPLRPPKFNASFAANSPKAPSTSRTSTTLMPIEQPVFTGSGFEAEVAELVSQIASTPQSEKAVRNLVDNVRVGIRHLFPQAKVIGFATGDFRHFKAFGVAVPEVDIVIRITTEHLSAGLRGRFSKLNCQNNLEEKKLQKSAVRAIVEALVSRGNFKFRRSAFRGLEPKVTMIAPMGTGIEGESVPVDISVNTVFPLHHMALITACERLEPRSKELILLVRRWAKDRGICHAAKGYLPPYVWSILTIYYLQVGIHGEEPVLPALHVHGQSHRVELQMTNFKGQADIKSTAELFKGFLQFYGSNFDWSSEVVSIRNGTRGAFLSDLPRNLMNTDNGTASFGPNVEDPSDSSKNLGVGVTCASFGRMLEELSRAMSLCARNASLVEILELWTPPQDEQPTPSTIFDDAQGDPFQLK